VGVGGGKTVEYLLIPLKAEEKGFFYFANQLIDGMRKRPDASRSGVFWVASELPTIHELLPL
jgi:hypothetical protein